jgi:hypothetical protein
MSVATREILKEKSYDNKVIVPNLKTKLVEKMIKGKGPTGQKKFLLGANRQKTC